MMKSRMFVPILFLFCFCSKQPALGSEMKDGLKILFVGNSLTYTNNLPELVKEFGKFDSVKIECISIVAADYSLDEHLDEGKVQKEIQNGHYDFVVVQHGPSAMPESQKILLESAHKYKALCEAAKTRLAFYMVWPSQQRLFDLDNVILSYGNAAKATGSIICPAGLAWKKAWAIDPNIALYGADGFHPSVSGSVLAALTIYGSVTGRTNFDFIKYDQASWKAEVTKEVLDVFKKSAAKAITE